MTETVSAAADDDIGRSQLAWWSALSEASQSDVFLSSWLALLASQLTGTRQALLVLGTPDTGPFEAAARYPADQIAEAACYELANETLQRREVALQRERDSLIIAYPIVIADELYGSVVVQASDQFPQTLLQKLRWGMGVLESWLLKDQTATHSDMVERLIMVIDCVAKSLQGQAFSDTSLKLVTELAVRLSCDRVSFGMRKRQRSRVLALSHSSKFARRMNLVQTIAETMDESIDQNTSMCLPRDASRSLQIHAHTRLLKEFGNAHVLTIPFTPAKRVYGAMVFERPEGQGFAPSDVELCQSIVMLVGRVLYRRQLQERHWWQWTYDAFWHEATRLLGPRHIARKLCALGLLAIVLFGVFAQGPFRVNADAVVNGVMQRTVAAPFDGYISTARHRAGDRVAAGEILARLDTREINSNLLRARNLEVQYSSQVKQAVASGKPAQAAIFRAQAHQAEAQIGFYEKRLQRADVKAPFAGVIISGDLSQNLGESVQRGEQLFKLSPMDEYRLWLKVPGKEISLVDVGQSGQLVLAAMPDRPLRITVQRIVPLAEVDEGKSIFRVQATLVDQQAGLLRPGMEGVGKIDIGQKRYIWIWTRSFRNWLRLKWWVWFG